MIRRKKIQFKPKLFSKPNNEDNSKKQDENDTPQQIIIQEAVPLSPLRQPPLAAPLFSLLPSPLKNVIQPTETNCESLNDDESSEFASLQPAVATQEPFLLVLERPLENLTDPHSLDCVPTPLISPFKPPNRPAICHPDQLQSALRTIESIQDFSLTIDTGLSNFPENQASTSLSDSPDNQQVAIESTKKKIKKKSLKDQNEAFSKKKKTKTTTPTTAIKKKRKKKADEEDDQDKTNSVAPKKKSKKKQANDNSSDETEPVEGNRRKRHKKWNGAVDKNKLTMFDLISYNPPPPIITNSGFDLDRADNSMDNELQISSNANSSVVDSRQVNNERLEDESRRDTEEVDNDENDKDEEGGEKEDEEKDDEEEEQEEDSTIGPRVRVNENGELVLDERSLVVKRKPNKSKVKTVYEDEKSISSLTNYASFRRKGKQLEKKSRWTDSETVKFYTALTIIGTDFTLMSELFFRNKRSRMDLKNKFKSEERYHKKLIDNALKKSDLENLNNLELLGGMNMLDDEEEEDEEMDGFQTNHRQSIDQDVD